MWDTEPKIYKTPIPQGWEAEMADNLERFGTIHNPNELSESLETSDADAEGVLPQS